MTLAKALLAASAAWMISSPALAQGGFVFLVSKHSDKCAQVNGASLANDAPITIWDCVNQTNVKWRLVDTGDGDGSVFIQAKHSDSCMHVHGGGNENGALITQWQCINQNNVKWFVRPAGYGYSYIVSKQSGKCLHVDGYAVANGSRMSQWDCVPRANVQWRLVPLRFRDFVLLGAWWPPNPGRWEEDPSERKRSSHPGPLPKPAGDLETTARRHP